MSSRLVLALPSKGRLMDNSVALLERAGYAVEGNGGRGYRGTLGGLDDVEIAFLPAGEIAQQLAAGAVHLGITGVDLIGEYAEARQGAVEIRARLGFGHADVVVAVPRAWLDVETMADLDEVSATFYQAHGRRLRVATKYPNLTRRFFAAKGVTGYLVVDSLGATEGAPAAGTAEVIVDITSTGSTLRANWLKVLADGVILRSEAVLASAGIAGLGRGARSAFAVLCEALARIPAENRPQP